jgi:hypothetical protein
VIVVQHVAGVDFLDLGDRADVPGDDLVASPWSLPWRWKTWPSLIGFLLWPM